MSAVFTGYRDQIWALVDAKSFYTSCEQVFDPALAGKPVVVLSNNDGCCVAISEQAKGLGIQRGAPWFKVEREARKLGVQVRSSNYVLYADMSRRFIEELSRFSPQVEQYSIDEAFVRLDGMSHENLTEYGKQIRDTIDRHLGLAVRVGIGATPTLAKLGNQAAKTYEQRLEGVAEIRTEHQRRWLLQRTDVQDIWGIGAKMATRLRTSGITTALQLADQNPADMRRLWNVGLARTVLELQGVACMAPGDIDEKRKQILSSRSFGVGISQLDELKAALAFHCQRAGEKLRQQGSQAGVVSLFLRTNRYKDLPQYNKSTARVLACPSQDTYQFLNSAIEQLHGIYRPGCEYQKIGVILNDLSDVQHQSIQLDMFDASTLNEVKRRKLMAISDQLNARYKNGVKPASVISSTNWHMRQAFRSNRWTTRLDELQVAKC
ncbi:Y-family DNA polymerase [Photobacterium atrarenae]|uniref:Y-family DNA polymerase n=1 Tax=Photobacterium atrarenae TaxID=865757 RepID=A0ABY5GNY8_9GAMM|nr:Y-family DNA polymerase [Photobacterium atrarenae]UTV30013.1 Y-family DNA polymerase [Photobacterium atrarenae]